MIIATLRRRAVRGMTPAYLQDLREAIGLMITLLRKSGEREDRQAVQQGLALLNVLEHELLRRRRNSDEWQILD